MRVVFALLLPWVTQHQALLVLALRQVLTQRVRVDLVVHLDDTDLLRGVLQLSDVSPPVTLLQQPRRLFVERQRRHLVTTAEIHSEFLEQQRDILFAFPQCRHADLHRVQTVIQVLTKTAVVYRLTHVQVRRCHHAHIRLAHLARTHPQELARL